MFTKPLLNKFKINISLYFLIFFQLKSSLFPLNVYFMKLFDRQKRKERSFDV